MRQPNSDPQPEPPEKPLPTDCCDSGCDPCIFESYLDELDRHQQALAEWRMRHPDSTV